MSEAAKSSFSMYSLLYVFVPSLVYTVQAQAPSAGLRPVQQSERFTSSPKLVAKFGSPTTVDPISEILKNVIIVDVSDYLPPNYHDKLANFEGSGDQDEEPEEVLDKTPVFQPKIPKVATRRQGGQLPRQGRLLPFENEGFLPDNDISSREDEVDEEEALQLDFSNPGLFEAILKGGSLPELAVVTQAPPTVERTTTPRTTTTEALWTGTTTTTTSTTTTTTSTTTTTVKSTTPGSCGEYCSVAGTLLILAGLDWDDDLYHHGTVRFMEAAAAVGGNLTAIFSDSYIGSAVESVHVEAFSPRADRVLVDFYLHMNGLVYDLSTLDLRTVLQEGLEPSNGHLFMGSFAVDHAQLDFIVTSTDFPIVLNHVEILDVRLPDWAWVVIIGGSASVLAVAVSGCCIAFMRKWNKRKVSGPKELTKQALADLKEGISYDTLDLEYDSVYRKDYWKSDIWTWAKMNDSMKTIRSPDCTPNKEDLANMRCSTMNSLPILKEKQSQPVEDETANSKFGLLRGHAEFDLNESFEI